MCVCVCDAGGSALQWLWSPEQQPDGELSYSQVCLYSFTVALDIYVMTHLQGSINQQSINLSVFIFYNTQQYQRLDLRVEHMSKKE